MNLMPVSNLLKKVAISFMVSVVLLFSTALPLFAQAAPAAPVVPQQQSTAPVVCSQSKTGTSCTTAAGKSGTCGPLVVGRGQTQYVCTEASTGSSSNKNLWFAPNPFDWYAKVYDTKKPDDIFGERYTAAQVTWIIYSIGSFPFTFVFGPEAMSCLAKEAPKQIVDIRTFLPGIIFASCLGPILDRTKDILIGYNPNSSSSLAKALMEPRDPSLITSVSSLLSNKLGIHIIPEVKAQDAGFGFKALSPILTLWKFSRDATYGLFSIALVALSFMVMFKVKLNPQTAITVQAAIPKVVIALILITFSYAIAGLLVDLMYIVYALLSLIIAPQIPAPLNNPVYAFNFLTGGITKLGGLGLVVIIAFVINLAIDAVLLIVAAVSSATIIVPIVAFAAAAIIFIITLIMVFKVIFSLFKAYAMALLLTIAAPFYIVLGVVIPSFGIGSWIRLYLSNLAVFVTTSILLFLSFYFMQSSLALLNVPLPFVIPAIADTLSNTNWPPLIGGGGVMFSSLVLAGAGLVIFTTIPKATELVQALIKGGQFNYGAAIGEAVGLATAAPMFVGQQAFGGVSGAASKYFGEQTLQRAMHMWGNLGNRNSSIKSMAQNLRRPGMKTT